MNISQIKNDLNYFVHFIRVPNYFIVILSILSGLLLLFAHSDFVFYFHLPQNYIYDTIYYYLDVELITFINYFFVFYCYASAYNINLYFQPFKKLFIQHILIAYIATIILVGFLTTLEYVVIKPIFNFDRLYIQLEHKLISNVLSSNGKPDSLFQKTKFVLPLGEKLKRFSNDSLLINHDSSVQIFMNQNKNEIERIFNQSFYYSKGKIDFPSEFYLGLSHANQIRNKGILEKALNFAGIKINRSDEGKACPSGTIIRNVFILLLFILLIRQKKDSISRKFSSPFVYVSLLYLIISIITLGLSRIYDYQHTLFDMMFSVFFALIILIVFSSVLKLYRTKLDSRIIKSFNQCIISLNKDGIIKDTSEEISDIIGISRRELINKDFFTLEIFNKDELKIINIEFNRLVNGMRLGFSNLIITCNCNNRILSLLATCTVSKRMIRQNVYLLNLQDLTDRTKLIKQITSLQAIGIDSKDRLIDYLLNIFKEFGFKRIRIYRLENKEFIGLKSISEVSLIGFENKRFSLSENEYCQFVLEINQPLVLSASILRAYNLKFDISDFEYLEIDNITEWLDIPIKIKKEAGYCYYIGLDKGKGESLNLTTDIVEIIDVLSKGIAFAFKNIDYHEQIITQKKYVEELLTLNINKSNIYVIMNDLKLKYNLSVEEWTVYLYSEDNNKLVVVSTNMPGFYEMKHDILFDSYDVNDDLHQLIIKSYTNSKLLTLEKRNEVFIASCINGLERKKVGAVIFSSKEKKNLKILENDIKRQLIENHLNQCSFILNRMLKDDYYKHKEESEIEFMLHDLNIPQRMRKSNEIIKLELDDHQIQLAVSAAQDMVLRHYRNIEDYHVCLENINFEELVRPFKFIVDYYARSKSIQVKYDDTLLDKNFEFKMDYNRLRLVLFELLDNAVKYSTSLTESKQKSLPFDNIELKCWNEDRILCFEISSTGEAYPGSWENDVFIIRRGDSLKVKKEFGSGKGLYRANRILSEINGQLKVTQKHNPTKFKITMRE